MSHTDHKASHLQNAAYAFLQREETAKAASQAERAFTEAKEELRKAYALVNGESRVVPVAPGEYVIVHKPISGGAYEFTYGVTNVVADLPEEFHYKDKVR